MHAWASRAQEMAAAEVNYLQRISDLEHKLATIGPRELLAMRARAVLMWIASPLRRASGRKSKGSDASVSSTMGSDDGTPPVVTLASPRPSSTFGKVRTAISSTLSPSSRGNAPQERAAGLMRPVWAPQLKRSKSNLMAKFSIVPKGLQRRRNSA